MKIPRKKRVDNVFTSILQQLNVKYTDEYADRLYNEHPYKYNMLGLSMMLTQYGVHNMGIRITNKEKIHSLELPFIAHIGNDFVTVKNISKEKINYHWHRKDITIPIKDFFDIWSGVVLIPESNKKSIEPDYNQHKRKERLKSIKEILLFVVGILLIGVGSFQQHIFQNPGLALLLTLNLTGVYIGYLLVQNQVYIYNNLANKICSLFTKSDCNNVLNSSAAKFMGVIEWSELGLSYFLSNTVILLFASHLLPYLVFLNICALPYSFWSIWYQKFRVKTWCPLCLIAQLLFWLIFITNNIWGLIETPSLTLANILLTGLIYIVPFFIINQLLLLQTTEQKFTGVTQHLNSLKLNNKVFSSLLKEQTYYRIDKNVSNITFGDANAKNTIIICSNPHCEPCSHMHKRIKRLLEDSNNQYCIQYILSSFDKNLDSSCEFFLYINRKYSKEERNKIYDEWFDNGKHDKESFFKKYAFTPVKEVSEEFLKHLEWKKEMQIQATPTVIFNGYKLPEIYFQEIEKLVFFTNIDTNLN